MAGVMAETIRFGPQCYPEGTPGIHPQYMFMMSPADIVIYGGMAGGGKTFALLLEPLRHIKNPKFRCTILGGN